MLYFLYQNIGKRGGNSMILPSLYLTRILLWVIIIGFPSIVIYRELRRRRRGGGRYIRVNIFQVLGYLFITFLYFLVCMFQVMVGIMIEHYTLY